MNSVKTGTTIDIIYTNTVQYISNNHYSDALNHVKLEATMWKQKSSKFIIALLISGAILLAGCDGLPFPTEVTATPEPVQQEEINPIISATGVVVPAQFTTLSMSTAGLVAEILVQEGDLVKEGKVIVRLEGKEELLAAIAGAEFEVSSAMKAIDDLHEQAETAKLQALDAIPVYARQVRDAQYQLDNFTVPSDQRDLEPMEALVLTKQQLDAARAAFEPYKERSSGDPIRRDLKEELDTAQSDYNAAVRRIEYVTALEVAEENLAKAQQDYEKYQIGPDPGALSVAEARLVNADAALTAARAALEDLELRALYAGTVTELFVRTGEWVVPGQAVVQLAELNHLRIETTDLNEIDAARITPGSMVEISFDALEDVIEGTVQSIAPKASQGSGVNYTVVIELDEMPEALRWGMTAFVDIEVE